MTVLHMRQSCFAFEIHVFPAVPRVRIYPFTPKKREEITETPESGKWKCQVQKQYSTKST